MIGRKLFKTRICDLYREGRCHRRTCSFAHGDAELRRYNNNSSASFNAGRRDYRAADFRDKLGRQLSPPRRNSHGHTPPRLEKKSEWSHRKRQQLGGENDYPGSLRLSDGGERQDRERKPSSLDYNDIHDDGGERQDREKKPSSLDYNDIHDGGSERQDRERKPLSSDYNDIHDERLKQVQSEIDMLVDHKQQLQTYLEESVQEADGLNSKSEELEMQLSIEKEECKRISSKIRKFLKAYNRHARIQEELKRSQARLQRLGDQLGSDARAAAIDEDNNNILSDEENLGNLLMSPKILKASPRKNEMFGNHLIGPRKDQYKASPSKKRMRLHMVEADERSKQAPASSAMRSERHSRWDPHLAETKNNGEIRTDTNGISNTKPLVNDAKPVQGKSNFNSALTGDKHEGKDEALDVVNDDDVDDEDEILDVDIV